MPPTTINNLLNEILPSIRSNPSHSRSHDCIASLHLQLREILQSARWASLVSEDTFSDGNVESRVLPAFGVGRIEYERSRADLDESACTT